VNDLSRRFAEFIMAHPAHIKGRSSNGKVTGDSPVSHPGSQHRPNDDSGERDEPLRLAEDADEDARRDPARADGRPSGGSRKPASGSSPSSGQPASPRSKSAAEESPGTTDTTDSTEGTSTGGFETMLGKLVVEQGLVTPDELEMCNALIKQTSSESSQGDVARTLGDLLVDNEFVTRRQLERIRGDFEAKKSGQRIPGYKVIRKLGAGAMATVFLARQLSLDRDVAIKVLPRKFSDNKKFIERFYKEGRAAAQLNHPNIVGAYDVGQAGEHHYFVMEYVDGETVYDRVVANKRIPEKEAIEIVRQVAEALKHAHEKGFIHRDIKPKNIMISSRSVVKLADLGLARAMSDVDAAKAEAGRAYGTPYYISPEQIRGEVKIGPPADIYGLGATFYHMVTGRVPFEGKNPSSVMHKHLKAELVPPDHINPKLSAGCAQVIEMMMAKDKKARYQTAEDLLTDLELVAKGKSPQFASKGFGIPAFVSPEELVPQSAPTAAPQVTGGSATDSPAFMMLLIGFIVSVLANALLIALLVFSN
jgi:eukaryotic-like serine/threonine-protein kinase